jgi:predicted transposase YbfD/YdcC
MDAQATAKIPRPFLQMPDPRRSNCRHKLIDILTIALFAIVCGAEDWVSVALYGRCKIDWLKTFLDLPHGIPAHDTFSDVFARLNPDAFDRCFQEWMASMVQLSGGKLLAIDGKSLRRSFEQGWDKSGMAHMVSAFVQANHMVFAQVKADGKGQELSAIQKLLEILDLEGAVVTIDALGCQKAVAAQILKAKADYILEAKENQPTLLAKLKATLDDCVLDHFKGMDFDFFEQSNGGHGRIETRKIWVCWDVELLGELLAEWPGVKSLIVMERTRQIIGKEKVSVELHYYISSRDRRTKAKRLAEYIRGHWSVENNLHWQLDISFREDERRIRKGHGAENFSRLCRLSLNLLKNEKSLAVGIANKRKNCGWDNDYLLKVALA